MEIQLQDGDFIQGLKQQVYSQQLLALSTSEEAKMLMLLARSVYSSVSIYVAAVHCKVEDFTLGMLTDVQLMRIIEPAYRHHRDPEILRESVIKQVIDLAIANTLATSECKDSLQRQQLSTTESLAVIENDRQLAWLMSYFTQEPEAWEQTIATVFYERVEGINASV